MATGRDAGHNNGLNADDPNHVREVRGWRWLVLCLAAALLRAWSRTLRLEADAATLARLTKSDEPAAIVLWHNRLFLSGEIFRRYRLQRPVYGLVSASKDGAWLAAFYRMVGIVPVRGSSSRLGREAAKVLIDELRAGHDVGITPDGPRGPQYTVEPGVLIVTRRTGAPLILIGAEFGPAVRLRSWDRFVLPWPGTRVRMRCTVLRSGAAGTKLRAEDVRAALCAINPDPPGA